MLAAAAKAEARGWATSEAENEGYKKTMASKGIIVQKPNPKLANELDEIGKTMAEDWVKKTGPTRRRSSTNCSSGL